MSTAVVKLTKGGRTLDLMSGRYNAGQDFKPPATDYEIGLAGGGSQNITGGAQVYTRKYVNREFSFQVKVSASGDASVRGALQALSAMLSEAGDENDPLYLEYNPNSDLPEPAWGQAGANTRYEIVDARLGGLWDLYGTATLRARTVFVTVECTLKPFALGKLQRLATATGGIQEDRIGSADGFSLGVSVPEATTNLFINPVFSASALWSACWSACSASLLTACTLEPAYVLPGTLTSVRLTATASTGNNYTQPVTASNTNTHTISAYIKAIDSSAVTASQCALWYAGALVTSYRAAGDGWYRLTASRAGIASACAAGVQVLKGQAVHATGFQLEEKAYATPLAYGDLLGCAWSGTSGSSTSTRTAASVKVPIGIDTVNAGAGTIRIIWKAPVSSANLSGNVKLFDDGASTNFRFGWVDATNTWLFSDGTNSVSSAADTFAADDTLAFHVTWSASGLAVYKNGASIASGASFTPPTLGAALYLGSNSGPSVHANGIFRGFAIFDRALTATQVAADYANLTQVVADGRQVEAVPWFWTDDGDNVLSLDTGKTPLGVGGGVPGSAAAETELQGTLSTAWSNIKSIIFSHYACRESIDLSDLLFDQSGTASAGDYGGQHYTVALTANHSTLAEGTLSIHGARQIEGAQVYLLARLFAASAQSFKIFTEWVHAAGAHTSACRTITPATSYRTITTTPAVIATAGGTFTGRAYSAISIDLLADTAACNMNVSTDYLAVLPGNLAILSNGNDSVQQWAYKRFTARQGAQGSRQPLVHTGNVIEFEPGRLNHLQCYFCPDGTFNPVTTFQNTIDAIYVTPRWRLM